MSYIEGLFKFNNSKKLLYIATSLKFLFGYIRSTLALAVFSNYLFSSISYFLAIVRLLIIRLFSSGV